MIETAAPLIESSSRSPRRPSSRTISAKRVRRSSSDTAQQFPRTSCRAASNARRYSRTVLMLVGRSANLALIQTSAFCDRGSWPRAGPRRGPARSAVCWRRPLSFQFWRKSFVALNAAFDATDDCIRHRGASICTAVGFFVRPRSVLRRKPTRVSSSLHLASLAESRGSGRRRRNIQRRAL
jgi:hypothetical protein